jgi:hypothetical protein
MRCTVEVESPQAFAMPRELQCVASSGRLSSVRDNHRRDARIVDRPRRTRARLVPQTVQPARGEAVTPLADGGLIHPEGHRYLLALQAFCAGQHDARPHCQRLRRLPPPCKRL